MTQQHTHYVDFPLAVSLNGSVAKISFGVGESVEEPHTVHTVAMPIASFVALTQHLRENLADPRFSKVVTDTLHSVAAEIQDAAR